MTWFEDLCDWVTKLNHHDGRYIAYLMENFYPEDWCEEVGNEAQSPIESGDVAELQNQKFYSFPNVVDSYSLNDAKIINEMRKLHFRIFRHSRLGFFFCFCGEQKNSYECFNRLMLLIGKHTSPSVVEMYETASPEVYELHPIRTDVRDRFCKARMFFCWISGEELCDSGDFVEVTRPTLRSVVRLKTSIDGVPAGTECVVANAWSTVDGRELVLDKIPDRESTLRVAEADVELVTGDFLKDADFCFLGCSNNIPSKEDFVNWFNANGSHWLAEEGFRTFKFGSEDYAIYHPELTMSSQEKLDEVVDAVLSFKWREDDRRYHESLGNRKQFGYREGFVHEVPEELCEPIEIF